MHIIHVFGFMGMMTCYQDMTLEEAASRYIEDEDPDYPADGERTVEQVIDWHHVRSFEHDGKFEAYDIWK